MEGTEYTLFEIVKGAYGWQVNVLMSWDRVLNKVGTTNDIKNITKED